MDLIIILAMAVALTALLVVREAGRNRRARQTLIDDAFDVDLRPPWSKDPGVDTGESTSRTQGAWSAWYRDGTLGAYVCTRATVTARDPTRKFSLSGGRIEIVEERAGRRLVLAGAELTINTDQSSTKFGSATVDIDEHISLAAPEPGRDAVLMLRLHGDGIGIERRLCPVEQRFARAGAALRVSEADRD